jgi:hypothetical protein
MIIDVFVVIYSYSAPVIFLMLRLIEEHKHSVKS